MLALGVCDALREAELLAEATHEGLSGSRPLELALADYERCRNEASLADYRENLQMASFGPVPPDVLHLRQALRGRPANVTRFFLARDGRISREEFFNSRNLERLMATIPGSVAA